VPPTVEIRGASSDLLHEIVREALPRFQSRLAAADRTLPRSARRELEAFVTCGDPANGFAWLVCEGCDRHRLVPFSCKGRGFCPSCAGRRMAERAKHWMESVIPRVAVRQWVLTVPWKRRLLLARHHDLARGVLGASLDEIFRWYGEQGRALGITDGRNGSVTAIQRFGSAINLNLHFHVLIMDGVHHVEPRSGLLLFRRVPAPRTEDVESLVARIAERAEGWLSNRGYPADDGIDPGDEDDGQLPLQAASLEGRPAFEVGGVRAKRTQTINGREVALPPRCATCDGFNLHANVAIAAGKRSALERLCRYILRPPLARARLATLPDGRVEVTLKRPWSDGTTALTLTRLEFLGRLAALVPQTQCNQTLYHGVLAPNSRWRQAVVPKPRPPKKRAERPTLNVAPADEGPARSRWIPWSELLRHVFGKDGWRCDGCGQPMKLRSVADGPEAAGRILRGLASASRAPPGERPNAA